MRSGRGVRLGAVLQVEQVQVGLGAVAAARGQARGLERPRWRGGDELVQQRLAVAALQLQGEGADWSGCKKTDAGGEKE